MAFTKRQEYKLEILPPYSIIQSRRDDIVEKDGVEVGRSYHRHVRCPGDDVSSDCQELQDVAGVLWTCLLYTSPSPRDRQKSRMPSSA